MLDVIHSFNSQYLKYAYYAVFLMLFVALVFLIKELFPLLRNSKTTVSKIKGITDKTAKIKEKTAKVKYTIDNSLPLFTKSFFILSLFHIINKDYKRNRKKGKNVKYHQIAIKQVARPNNMAKLKSII